MAAYKSMAMYRSTEAEMNLMMSQQQMLMQRGMMPSAQYVPAQQGKSAALEMQTAQQAYATSNCWVTISAEQQRVNDSETVFGLLFEQMKNVLSVGRRVPQDAKTINAPRIAFTFGQGDDVSDVLYNMDTRLQKENETFRLQNDPLIINEYLTLYPHAQRRIGFTIFPASTTL